MFRYTQAMDIYWGGQSLFKLKGKTSTVVIDPFSLETGLKLPKDLEADSCLITHAHPDHNNSSAVAGNPLVITGPGEYEVKGVAITGIQAFHDNSGGSERGKVTIYHIYMDGLNIVHLGDLGQTTLTEEQVSEIGVTDILMVPVGGVYTITANQATAIIAQLEPSIVLPMHYKIEGLKYELEPLTSFLKEMGLENIESQPKLSVTKEKLPEETQVVVLSKT